MSASEEWIFPKPKKTRKRAPPPPTQPQPQPQPQRTDAHKSPAALKSDHLSFKKAWSSSPCCTSLRTLITTHKDKLPRIKRAICLGIGTFDPDDASWEKKRRTHHQYIAFLTMIEELEKINAAKMECIFQEPLFTEHEKTFLRDMGHRVVDHPEGCTSVTGDSLLYGVHLYRDLYEQALGGELPGIFVGTDWDTWDRLLLDVDSVRGIKTMHEGYEKRAFPEDGTTFSSTSFYWRKEGQGGREKHDLEKDLDKDLVDRLDRVEI